MVFASRYVRRRSLCHGRITSDGGYLLRRERWGCVGSGRTGRVETFTDFSPVGRELSLRGGGLQGYQPGNCRARPENAEALSGASLISTVLGGPDRGVSVAVVRAGRA